MDRSECVNSNALDLNFDFEVQQIARLRLMQNKKPNYLIIKYLGLVM